LSLLQYMIPRQIVLMVMFVFLLANTATLAQQKNVSGKVSDSRDNALPGVNVSVSGTTVGTATDADGRFVISIPDGFNTLMFSFIGFVTREVKIDNQSVVDVMLTEDVKRLDEVVVTALNVERNIKAVPASVLQ
jgi:hypothetical protein